MSNLSECAFCGRYGSNRCQSTRDMKDASWLHCYAALLFHGGGEYTSDRLLSAELMRRAGLAKASDASFQPETEPEPGLDCSGCRHLWYVQPKPYATSAPGWGCLLSGGHALQRCSGYETEPRDG